MSFITHTLTEELTKTVHIFSSVFLSFVLFIFFPNGLACCPTPIPRAGQPFPGGSQQRLFGFGSGKSQIVVH